MENLEKNSRPENFKMSDGGGCFSEKNSQKNLLGIESDIPVGVSVKTVGEFFVKNIQAFYSSSEQKIFMRWENTDSVKFSGFEISCKKQGSNEDAVVSYLGAEESSHVINGIEGDDSIYSITVTAIDDFDNRLGEEIIEIEAVKAVIIESISIPMAGTSYAGKKIPVVVKGRNFLIPNAEESRFKCSVSALKFGNLKILDDKTAVGEITCPSNAGETIISVNYGSSSASEVLNIKDYSSFSVGDVILSDDTKIAYSESRLFTDEQKKSAVAVIFGFNIYGVPLGIGIYNSAARVNRGIYKWAPRYTTGYHINFKDLICDCNSDSGIVTFSGNMDGSKSWECICGLDPLGTADPATNYPAFNYVLNYAKSFSLPERYSEGWYLPSVAELYTLYTNKITVNRVLSLLDGTPLIAKSYWSSSQYSFNIGSAWYVLFDSGSVYYNFKYFTPYVCCIRAF